MKTGDIIKVTFLDHVQNHDEPLEFCVVGRLAKKTKLSLTLQVWYEDKKIEPDNNTEFYTIIRSCISEAVVMSPKTSL